MRWYNTRHFARSPARSLDYAQPHNANIDHNADDDAGSLGLAGPPAWGPRGPLQAGTDEPPGLGGRSAATSPCWRAR
jgi:hypothetical protein